MFKTHSAACKLALYSVLFGEKVALASTISNAADHFDIAREYAATRLDHPFTNGDTTPESDADVRKYAVSGVDPGAQS